MIKRSKVYNVIGLSLLILTLGGCAKNTATVEEVMEEITTTELSDTEDMTLEPGDVILQVGDSSVSYREVLFYIYQAKEQYETDLGSAVWDVVLEDGSTFEEYAREEILRELTEVKVITEEAKNQQVSLTSEEEAEAENKAALFLEGVSEEDKELYDFQIKTLQDIYVDNAIADKMYAKTAKSVQEQLKEEDYRQVKVQYIQVMTNGTDKDGNAISMTDEEKEKAFTRAGKLLDKAKEAEDFEAFALEKTDAAEVTATFGIEDVPDNFGEASLSLKTGEFSDVMEGNDGYYIVYCVSENVEKLTAKKFAAAKDELESGAFEEAYTKWSEEYGVEVSVKLWKAIQVKDV